MKVIVGQKTPGNLLCIGIATVFALLILLCLIPTVVFAQSETVRVYGNVPKGLYKQYTTNSEEPCFCFDADLYGPSGSGQAYSTEFEWAPNDMSYLMLKSFPATNTFDGKTYSDTHARFISQIALWIYRGFITEDGRYTEKAKNGFNEKPGQKASIIANQDRTFLTAAVNVVKEVRKQGASTTVAERYRSRLYKPKNKSYQRMLVPPNRGSLKLTKSFAGVKELLNLKPYSTEGIRFEVWSGEEKTNEYFTLKPSPDNALLATGINGVIEGSNEIKLLPGTYQIKETNTPPGITPIEPIPVTIKANQTTSLGADGKLTNALDWCKMDVLLVKHENENSTKPLENAEFTVQYFVNKTDASPVKSWQFRTNAQGEIKFEDRFKIAGDSFFVDEQNHPILPFGWISIEETKAPPGYYTPPNNRRFIEITKQTKPRQTFNSLSWPNTKERADFSFTKIDAKTNESLAFIPFKITNKTTGESHIILTDAQGNYSSASAYCPHSTHTNMHDSLLQVTDPINLQNVGKSGLWFEGSSKTPCDDNQGALTPDIYLVEELASATNQGYKLTSFEVDTRTQKEVAIGHIANHPFEISTMLTTGSEERFVPYTETHHLTDEISLVNLPENKTYTLRTTLHVINEEGEIQEPVQVNGVNFEQTQSFTTTTGTETISTSFDIPGEAVAGKRVVCFEEILDVNEVILAHKDPRDENQILAFRTPDGVIHKTGSGQEFFMWLVVGISSICSGGWLLAKLPRLHKIW